jgi:spore maturation protein CgeB
MSTVQRPMRVAIFGLSITSSWGNGHATTYRSLVKGLVQRGHEVTFYERRQSWYEDNQDLRHSSLCEIVLYDRVEEIEAELIPDIENADLVMIGSYVPEGARVIQAVLRHAKAVTAFYDIDTPVTLAALDTGQCNYLTAESIPRFDLYFSFAGGSILETLQRCYGARRAVPLYCSVDADEYFPLLTPRVYELGYLGTYSADRQPKLQEMLLEPARSWTAGTFCVAGPQYPETIAWPPNVRRIEHVAPGDHRLFYNSQRFTLNITRRDMVEQGFSPSVRLFEAAACGVPIISDAWNGLEDFFTPGQEILIARSKQDVLRTLHELPAEAASELAARARARVLREHTSEHRARELEQHVESCRAPRRTREELQWPVTRPSSASLH